MYSKILFLRFPKTEVRKPVVCELARDFNLTFTILHATVFPRREGMMVLDLSGNEKDFKKGVKYLKEQGVKVKDAAQEISRDEKHCTQCGACTAICPTGALSVDRNDMSIPFDIEKCSVCQLCIPTCPTRAMKASSVFAESFFNDK